MTAKYPNRIAIRAIDKNTATPFPHCFESNIVNINIFPQHPIVRVTQQVEDVNIYLWGNTMMIRPWLGVVVSLLIVTLHADSRSEAMQTVTINCADAYARYSPEWKQCVDGTSSTISVPFQRVPGSGGGGISKGGGLPSTPSKEVGPAPDNTVAPPAEDNTKLCPSTKNPVVLATGEKYLEQVDFRSGSRYGLSLVRTYRSQGTGGSMFGPKWLSNLDTARVKYTSTPCAIITVEGVCVPQTATLVEPDGTRYKYTYKAQNSFAKIADLRVRKEKVKKHFKNQLGDYASTQWVDCGCRPSFARSLGWACVWSRYFCDDSGDQLRKQKIWRLRLWQVDFPAHY